MEASRWLWEERKIFGKCYTWIACLTRILIAYRGAYIAAVIITLLDLPLELPRESPAWSREGATLLTLLPEWVTRCKSLFSEGHGNSS
jgi:hypothetical protein